MELLMDKVLEKVLLGGSGTSEEDLCLVTAELRKLSENHDFIFSKQMDRAWGTLLETEES